tara:strand:+ start:27 stop:344 length:318 start_codon:yes stop_codon:yes gene_type:complete
MTKTLKQYLSLRGLLAKKLKEKKREIKAINKLLLDYPKTERMLAYCRDNKRVKSYFVYHHKSNSSAFTTFEVNFIGLEKAYVVKIEDLLELNSASEQLKQLKVYD